MKMLSRYVIGKDQFKNDDVVCREPQVRELEDENAVLRRNIKMLRANLQALLDKTKGAAR